MVIELSNYELTVESIYHEDLLSNCIQQLQYNSHSTNTSGSDIFIDNGYIMYISTTFSCVYIYFQIIFLSNYLSTSYYHVP